ncbi:MAG TPA: FHA domain-containing protein [Polyangiaceae bacterium]|nr:FHA domain-containing protein [Polyangiaceae bacterium]
MSILDQLGRQTIRLGSAPDAELRIEGPDVAAYHAEIVHQGQGRLLFVPGPHAPSFWNERQLEAGVPVPFDFQSHFYLGRTPVPLTHPVICQMVMRRGYLPAHPQELVVGRDPERAHLVLVSPGVSSRHATLRFPGPTLTDHHSTSGTWHEGVRLQEETPISLPPNAIVAVGPLPLPLELAAEFHRAQQAPVARAHSGATQPMIEAEAPPPGSVPVPAGATGRHRTLMGTVRMEMARARSIGRTNDNDIVLDHPQISGRHARLFAIGPQLYLEDQGSELGTYVRGTRLRSGQRAPVSDGERVLFGPLPAVLRIDGDAVDVLLEDQANWAGRPLYEVEARGVCFEVADRHNPGQTKRLLDDVSFRALPGDMIALMGPSGSGKTTLLHMLTGYLRPTSGDVLVNGQPLDGIFDALRGSIGYVPQDDIIHAELTVWEAVRYSARLRLPRDYSDEEIDRRVQQTLSQLGLEGVARLQIGKPEAKVLSGGQRKRVNIALELVTDPVLLFLDEPTSGLAADDTTALIELLSQLARTTGKTILATIHQPAQHEYERFNLALVLGHGGVPLYFGPTREAYAFFESWRPASERVNVDNPRDMFAELAEREARLARVSGEMPRAALRRRVAEDFRQDFERSRVYSNMQEGPRSVGRASAAGAAVTARKRPPGQLAVLLDRYLRIKLRDRAGTAILLLQAPIIGVLLALVFGSQKPSVPYWCLGALEALSRRGGQLADGASGVLSRMHETRDFSGAQFFLVVAAIWFGTSNAAREVVGERSIYRRERMVHLGIVEYLLSKFVVLCALSTLQCAILLGIVFTALGLGGGAAGFAIELGMLMLTSFAAVGLGLLLSAVVVSAEAAMALTPIALIPQVVLGGLMVPSTTVPWLRLPMLGIPARWGFEGVARVERLAQANDAAWRIPLGQVPDSPPDFVRSGAFYCAEAQLKSSDLLGAWGFWTADTAWLAPSMLVLFTLLCLGATGLVLARRDRR